MGLSPLEDPTFPAYIVGVGASAGGLRALEALFHDIKPDAGFSFVVVQHLSPDHKSLMDELLSRITTLSVDFIQDGVRPQVDTIYLMPAGAEVSLINGRFELTTRDTTQLIPLPIDHFFSSLAQAMGNRAIGIILSGTGSDGSSGLIDIHNAGGLVLVQEPRSAEFDGMPLNAIQTGHTDLTLPPEQMGTILVAYLRDPIGGRKVPEQPSPVESPINTILRILWEHFGIDFTYYKTTTISRRIERRLSLSKDIDIASYAQRLETDTQALEQLYRDLLVGVTQFFRDPDAFDYLERDIIPSLLDTAETTGSIRIWVAGCATGEEAYSLAILFHEAISQQSAPIPIQIFATDVHQTSIDFASSGFYSQQAVRNLTPERLKRYFTETQNGYQVIPAIRQQIVFARHDITRDSPFSNLNLITCRNVLIYLRSTSQEQILQRFSYGLVTGGTLMLGPSESLRTMSSSFTEINLHWKVYRKTQAADATLDTIPLLHPIPQLREATQPQSRKARPTPSTSTRQRLYEHLLNAIAPLGILVNAEGQWEHVFGDLSPFLVPMQGPNNAHVLNLVQPELRSPLHAAIIQATNERQEVVYRDIPVPTLPHDQRVTLRITPLDDQQPQLPALFIAFEKVCLEPSSTSDSQSQSTTVTSPQVSHLLEQELQQTKAALQITTEELQTRTQELQTINEELIASNEELQSSNEELHSVNEELHTVNTEYQSKNQQLIALHTDTENLLRSTEIGTIFLDANGCIRKYTPAVQDAIPLQAQDIGRPLNHLTPMLDLAPDMLSDLLQQVFTSRLPQTREVRTTQGAWLLMRIHPFVTATLDVEGTVVTFIDISEHKRLDELQHKMLEHERSHAALDQFVHVASHDLRAPLRAIHNLATWIAEDSEETLSATSRRDLKLLQERTTKMEGLLETLLQYAYFDPQTTTPEIIDSGQLVQDLLLLLDIPSDCLIDVITPMPTLFVPEAPLKLVFRNVLSYVLRHQNQPSTHLSISGETIGHQVTFSVTNSTDHHLPLPSDSPIETESPGSRFNMAFVEHTIARHGGSLQVEATPEKGTTLYFTWPKTQTTSLETT